MDLSRILHGSHDRAHILSSQVEFAYRARMRLGVRRRGTYTLL